MSRDTYLDSEAIGRCFSADHVPAIGPSDRTQARQRDLVVVTSCVFGFWPSTSKRSSVRFVASGDQRNTARPPEPRVYGIIEPALMVISTSAEPRTTGGPTQATHADTTVESAPNAYDVKAASATEPQLPIAAAWQACPPTRIYS